MSYNTFTTVRMRAEPAPAEADQATLTLREREDAEGVYVELRYAWPPTLRPRPPSAVPTAIALCATQPQRSAAATRQLLRELSTAFPSYQRWAPFHHLELHWATDGTLRRLGMLTTPGAGAISKGAPAITRLLQHAWPPGPFTPEREAICLLGMCLAAQHRAYSTLHPAVARLTALCSDLS